MRRITDLLSINLLLTLLVGMALVGCDRGTEPVPTPASTSLTLTAASPNTDSRSQTGKSPTIVQAADPPSAAATPHLNRAPASPIADTLSEADPSPTVVPASEPAPTANPVPLEKMPAGSEGESGAQTGYVLTAPPATDQAPGPESEFPGRGTGGITESSEMRHVSGQEGSAQGQPYTWQDGDRTLTVLLQADLTVQDDGEIAPREEPEGTGVARSNEGKSVEKKDSGGGGSDDQPVFRSESGALMTLPGGVLLALDPEWAQAETDAFFASNGISLDRVSELEFVTNGFFVETEPGFPSLNLANSLAKRDGVVLSSPNWWTEISPE